jgi:hypothetical protein
MLHVDPLLGSDRNTDDCTAAVARQRLENSNRMVFSVQSVQNNWNDELLN